MSRSQNAVPVAPADGPCASNALDQVQIKGWSELFAPPWLSASLSDRLALAEALLQAELEAGRFDADEEGPMLLAARAGDAEMIERLAQWGYGVEPRDEPKARAPLFEALHLKDLPRRDAALRALIAAGAKPRPFEFRRPGPGLGVIGFAIHLNRNAPESIPALARAGLDFSDPIHAEKEGPPLLCALGMFHRVDADVAALIRELLEAGADPNARREDGASPLSLAAAKGFPECVRALLAAGADPRSLDALGRCPLELAMKAALFGDEEPGAAAMALLQASPPPPDRVEALLARLSSGPTPPRSAPLAALRALGQADALSGAMSAPRPLLAEDNERLLRPRRGL